MMLKSMADIGIIHTTPRGKNIIKPGFYRTLSQLYTKQIAQEIENTTYQ